MASQLASSNLSLIPSSLVVAGDVEYSLASTDSGPRLVVLAPISSDLTGFKGEGSQHGEKTLLLGPLSPKNAAALRLRLTFLQPRTLGLQTSAGMGDRLGLATPGHVRAARAAGGKVAPIFAQQSIREMTRTGRTPQQVMDDATWGIFREGWQNGVGADADHLKTTADIDACLAAGYTFFTIDPGTHVDNRAETASLGELREMADQLPEDMKTGIDGLKGRTFKIEHLMIQFDEATLLKAAVKYAQAVEHVSKMYHHLEQAAGQQPFELEVSVDETEQPTSHAEHIYIASELSRLGVCWVSLAPRYIGRFEKGVDYIGDIANFEVDLSGHAAIARQLGPYKLSLHSGSDKFSIYPAMMRQTHGLVHLKTAGTSYLEALRTAAYEDPELFQEIYRFACERYETDRASYHVSGELSNAPEPQEVQDWPALLEQFDAREILHVTYGSVLTEQDASGKLLFYDRLMGLLVSHLEDYTINLERHFTRHLAPFAAGG